MKVLIPIVIGLLVLGCGQKEELGDPDYILVPSWVELNFSYNYEILVDLGPTPGGGGDSGLEAIEPKPTRELTPEEKKIVGTYEWRVTPRTVDGIALLDNGILELQKNGNKITRNEWNQIVEYRKWSLVGNEVHAFMDDNTVWVFRVNSGISIIYIAEIKYGARIDYQTRVTYKKIKSEGKETISKGEDNNDSAASPVKVLKPEDVVGSYEAGVAGSTFRFILLKNGVVENYFDGRKEPADAKWKIQGAEVHVEKGKSDGTVIVNKIEANGDFTVFARMRNGKREDYHNRTYKKIK